MTDIYRAILIIIILSTGRIIFSRNPVNSQTEAVKVYDVAYVWGKALVAALLASGFRRVTNDSTNELYDTLLPCPVGTFSNFSSKGEEGCIECPPGIS